MRSSYIEWLFEQQYRIDDIGYLVKWVLSFDEFDPVEFPDILDQIEKNPLPDNMMGSSEHHTKRLRSIAYESLVEFATEIKGDEPPTIVVIEEKDILEQKLENALKYENYLEAAKLRDELNKLK